MFVKIGTPEKIINVINEEIKLSEKEPFYITKDSNKLKEEKEQEKE